MLGTLLAMVVLEWAIVKLIMSLCFFLVYKILVIAFYLVLYLSIGQTTRTLLRTLAECDDGTHDFRIRALCFSIVEAIIWMLFAVWFLGAEATAWHVRCSTIVGIVDIFAGGRILR